VHGEDGVHGAALPEPAAPADPRHAVRLLADAIAGSAAPVTLVAIGPLTNVALLYALHPEMAARLGRLVVMGGSADAGNVTPAAEFNVWSDPEAAYRVLTEPGLPTPVPTALVTLDLTLGVPLAEPDLGRLRAGGPAGRAAAAMLAPALARSRRLHGRNSVPVHDAVAVAEVVRPGLLDLAGCTVTVDCGNGPGRGGTSVDRFAALPWLTVSTGADKEGVIDLLIGRVGRLAPYPS
jgi:pyrimidine-specific ribonucleoside hydrolase